MSTDPAKDEWPRERKPVCEASMAACQVSPAIVRTRSVASTMVRGLERLDVLRNGSQMILSGRKVVCSD